MARSSQNTSAAHAITPESTALKLGLSRRRVGRFRPGGFLHAESVVLGICSDRTKRGKNGGNQRISAERECVTVAS
jgi:hypothetical protein